MDHFAYKHGVLHAENVSVEQIAHAVGTPFYCYSTATLLRHVAVLRESLAALNPRICFAVKANSNRAVLATLASAGVGADVVSQGEAMLAQSAGIAPANIIFSGVGKTRDEMRYGLEQGIFQFNVESEAELRALSEVAQSMGTHAPIAIRINPDVDAETHAKISTGKKDNKFGVALSEALALYALARSLPSISVQGVSMHIGSQLTSLAPFRAAYTRARAFVLALRAESHSIRTLDIGGGLGVPYQGSEIPPRPADYGAMASEIFTGLDCEMIVEPGRLIAGNAGILVSRVLYTKQAERHYTILDAAMNDLMRPALYDAFHEIVPVREATDAAQPTDVVGPVCESSDCFGKDYALPPLAEGALVAFRTAGAYGASMSNSYNSRLLIPEVLVHGDAYAIVRARLTYADLLKRDSLAPWQN